MEGTIDYKIKILEESIKRQVDEMKKKYPMNTDFANEVEEILKISDVNESGKRIEKLKNDVEKRKQIYFWY